jgi:hypothetical protein
MRENSTRMPNGKIGFQKSTAMLGPRNERGINMADDRKRTISILKIIMRIYTFLG